MGFWDHMEALRTVLVRSAAIVGVGMLLCFAFAARLQDLLVQPFSQAVHALGLQGTDAGRLALLSPTEGFMVRLKIAFFAGLFLASPFVFWQLWSFVAPGLHQRERRLVVPITTIASLLFLAGAAVGWLAMGLATEFLLGFTTPDIANMWSLGSYLSFTVQIMMGLGLVFQLPLVLVFLVHLGILHTRQLAEKRRHAVVGILVAVALLPMQDPMSLVLMSAPLYVLYELSILVGRLLERRKASASPGGLSA
jgi:sec-independent protein translocase protein TatC